jgi:PAS domain S-box-containing protein
VTQPVPPARLASLADVVADAVVLLDAAGMIVWASAAATPVLGHASTDLVGLRAVDLLEPDDRAAWQELVQALLDRPADTARGTFRCRHRDGRVRVKEALARNLLHDPRICGIVISYRDVSDRQSALAALSTEDRFGHLFSRAADIIFEADPEGYFRFVNPQTLHTFEYSADEVVGRRFTEFIRADYRQQILQHYYQQTTQGTPNSYIEFPALTKSGREVWLGQKAWLLTDARGRFIGMQAVARDITERRRAEEALRAAEAKFRALVEQSLMGVYILQDDRLVYVNPKAAALLGYSDRELLEMPTAFDVLHEEDRPFVIEQLGRLGRGVASVQFTARGVRKDGEIVQAEAFCSLAEVNGRPAVLATVSDISERVNLEGQLRQAQKMEAIGRLAGGIAHDFNNLLTAIRGNAELMADRVAHDPEMKAELEEILHAADRAASLTRQLLAFSRKQVLQPVPLDVNEIVRAVSRMARRLIGADVRMRMDLASSVAKVLADPAQVEQVLLNLIVNARDAMPDGGLITVRTGNVRLEPESPEIVQAGIAPGPFVMLDVSDTGLGMDQATQARIFEPFFTTKETGRGTGLGLATVYGIVRQTGGAITVTSERGRGASFRIYLPAITGETS